MQKKTTLQTKSTNANLGFPSILNDPNAFENTDMRTIMAVMDKLLHWAAIIDSTDDAIISKSLEGYITSWNKGAEKLYGYTPEEVIGKPVSVLMPPEKVDDFPMILQRLREGKKVEHYETKRKTKDGRIIDVAITVSPIRDSHGTIIGASKIARDISSRVESERRRDEFVNTVSHELKTPLTTQKAFGQLLENLINKNGDTQYKTYIEKLNRQTEKLEKLVNDLLELSRARTGRLVLEQQPVVVDTLLSEIVSDMQKISHHTIELTATSEATIVGDRDRLGQVLMNLLSNAIKYSSKADTIKVRAYQVGNEVLISIQDFGIGIDKIYHEKIFERFFRVIGDKEKTFPGMGIGLDFSREMVLLHGGRIWVESEKGKGSTFFVALPLVS